MWKYGFYDERINSEDAASLSCGDADVLSIYHTCHFGDGLVADVPSRRSAYRILNLDSA
jgi:hypothetical protein